MNCDTHFCHDAEAPGYLERVLGVVCPVDRDFADYCLEYLTDPGGTIQRQQDRETPPGAGCDQAGAQVSLSPSAKAALFSSMHAPQSTDGVVTLTPTGSGGIVLEPGACSLQYASKYHLSLWQQLLVCTSRTAKLQLRDRHNYLKYVPCRLTSQWITAFCRRNFLTTILLCWLLAAFCV